MVVVGVRLHTGSMQCYDAWWIVREFSSDYTHQKYYETTSTLDALQITQVVHLPTH